MDFIIRIEDLLQAKKVSKKALLNDLGLNRNSFSAWRERGTIPSAETLLKIAKYLDTTIDYLLTGETADLMLMPEPKREMFIIWDKLDDAGKTIIKAKAIEELRRLEG